MTAAPTASPATSLLVSLLAVIGLGIVVGPWIYRLAADLTAERAERVRTQDRADVAAHLHDSVLQTLALIQKNSHDGPAGRAARPLPGARPARLALLRRVDRREHCRGRAAQGRRHRRGRARHPRRTGRRSATCPYSESLIPIVKATGEAVTNAAKHAGVDRVDVYAEVTDEAVAVFVRDRGVGFDPADIPQHRFGVRQSIHDRMARHGGTAEIRSTPGEGTEVRLHLPTGGTHDE